MAEMCAHRDVGGSGHGGAKSRCAHAGVLFLTWVAARVAGRARLRKICLTCVLLESIKCEQREPRTGGKPSTGRTTAHHATTRRNIKPRFTFFCVRRHVAVLILALLVCGLCADNAQAVSIAVLADTYVSSISPTTNFGPLEILSVSSKATTLLRFPLTSLPAGITPNQIVKATLQLWVNSPPSQDGSIRVAPASSAWVGGTVTWNTKPSALASPSTTKAFGAGGSKYYLEVDVTPHVQMWVKTPSSNLGFVITAVTTATNVLFDSKENTATSRIPLLDITLTNGKSVAVCLESSSRVCGCAQKTLSSESGAYCQAVSESGSCYATGYKKDGPDFGYVTASCCVCAP
jgi:hypothetical protein